MGTSSELARRITWALARLGTLVNVGREAGWLSGPQLPVDAVEPDEPDASSPMTLLAARLGLSELELDALWLLVCIELDPALARAAQLLASPNMYELNAQVLERLLANEDRALDSDSLDRLARFGLIETTTDARVPLFRRAVRPSDRVLDLARGKLTLDRELGELATLESAWDVRYATAAFAIEVAPELTAALAAGSPLIVAKGIEGSGRGTLLRHAVAATGHAVLVIRAPQLATEPALLNRQLRAIVRECRLHDAWPLLLEIDGLDTRVPATERELLATYRGPVLATAHEACTWPVTRTLMTIEVALPDESQRATMWQAALGTSAETAATCARRYKIAPGLLARAATAAQALAPRGEAPAIAHVHTALRAQLERNLTGLATRIETRQTWDDLVLPGDQFDLLLELIARVRHRRQVLETWGFAKKVGKGLGLSTLLSGPPGTGKTMIAGLIARDLGLDLYQVDLSRIVSKYIGETEKQLAALFEAAESGHAILLFDEADSLFGKRTEVKSSNDRYANLEVNYLLQRMEAFSGISILTTNHETAIDEAFQRRLALHIRVPMPERDQREQLWRTMMPDEAERADGLEVEELAAEFVMSGGYIKNAVLRAAYYAADQGTAIDSAHLWRAAHAEYESMGKVTFRSGARGHG